MELFSQLLENCPNCAKSLVGVLGCRCPQHDRTCPNCGKRVIIVPVNRGESNLRVLVAVDFADTHSDEGQKKIEALRQKIISQLNRG